MLNVILGLLHLVAVIYYFLQIYSIKLLGLVFISFFIVEKWLISLLLGRRSLYFPC